MAVAKRAARGIAEWKKRATDGDGAAAAHLGDYYRAETANGQDYRKALFWYRRGAELGDPSAQNDLGTMLLNGIGCERAPEQAVDWYRKSAEQGLAIAQYNLAKRYLHGDGVALDYAEALKWFERAALQGETVASCELGTMHRFGQGVPRNLLAAAEFHLTAAEAGDEVAILGNIAEYRPELEDLALAGSQLASLFLSRIYNRGFGIEASQSMTWAWIWWAREHCSSDVYADSAEDVGEAYAFYRMSVDSRARKAGEQLLKKKALAAQPAKEK
jgi:TPR repeat protein